MHNPAMSVLGDSAIVHSKCHSRHDADTKSLPPRRSLRKAISIPAVSSVVKGSWNWAGDTLGYYRDGLSAEQRRHQVEIEDRKQVLYLKIQNAVSYEEWCICANELDVLENNNAWKQTFECTEYHPQLVQERLRQLEEARISCDVSRMLFLVRTALSRDLGKMSNSSLYRHSHIGTKDLIDRYITTALDTINTLVDLSVHNRCDGLELKYILDQLLASRQAFGRSALLFSGGATFGMNHIGVLKTLYEAKLIPRIISGASAGSIVCAVFCTRNDEELPALLDTYAHGDFAVFNETGREENIFQKTARFLKFGSFLDISHLANTMRAWLGDITFQEAYNRTRRILNICVSSAGMYELPRLLNYISAPNVMIWSAVAVSCSVPLVFRPYNLMAKDPLTGQAVPWNDLHKQYIDGSVDGDLPMTRLSEMFNVNHFIVSQVNPHVVPFLPKGDGPTKEPDGSSFVPRWMNTMTHLAKDEVLHRVNVLSELGIFPTSMTKFASIVNQKYSGDINIYPELISSNFPRILENPTTEFMLQACISGERATWPKLSRIRNHCAIELALDRAIQQMRARVAFSPGQVDLRMQHSIQPSSDSMDSSAGRGRMENRRRGSHSHELERRRPRGGSQGNSTQELRKARSTVSLENTHLSLPDDFISALSPPKAHNRRSSITFGGGIFEVGSSSDDDNDNDDSEDALSGHSGRSISRESWDVSSLKRNSNQGTRSPVQTRRSSFSGRTIQAAPGRRESSKETLAPSAREVSMALSPSSRHLLNMTPKVQPTSPNTSTRKSRN